MLKKAIKAKGEDPFLEQLRLGDRKAQYEFYKNYGKAMYNTAYRIVKDQGLAEDVLQEAFLDAFKKIESFRGESTIGAWLKKIVVNKALNQIQRNKWDFESEFNLVHEEDASEPQYSWNHLNIDRVNRALEKLPDGFRTVFSLYLLEGYDHEEISQILGISVSTSKSQYKRAKDKLKNLLKA